MDFVHHVDVVGIRNVNHWALWWSGEETHEHECTNQTCSILSFLGEVNNGMLAEKNLLGILQQSDERILAGVRQASMWNLDVQSVVNVGRLPSKDRVVGQVVTHNNPDRLTWWQVLY